jgi:dienelactone hydrolase
VFWHGVGKLVSGVCSIILVTAIIGLFIRNCGAETIRTEVKGENFVADFYCNEPSTPRPGILFLGGSEGGRPNRRLPEFLAENGYAVLAVAYYKEKGLPQTFQMIPLEYFDTPIAWINHSKSVAPGRTVLVGGSKGAELALLLASRKPEIAAVIALSPCSVVWEGPTDAPPPTGQSSWSFQGKPIPFVPFDYRGINEKDPLFAWKCYKNSLMQKAAVEKASIEVEKIHGPILLFSGQDDQLGPCGQMADAICDRLKAKGFKYKYEHVDYPDAGHTLTEHYMIGGTPEGNKKARIASGMKMLEFLHAVEVAEHYDTSHQ